MSITIERNGSRWTARFYDGAGRLRQNTCGTLLQAEMSALMGAGPRSRAGLAGLSLEVHVQAHLAEMTTRGVGHAATSTQRRVLENYVLPEMGQLPVGQLDVEMFNDLLEGWNLLGQSDSTIRNRMLIVERAMDYAWRRNSTTSNPARDAFKHKRPATVFGAPASMPSEADVALLRHHATDGLHGTVLELVLATRPSDAEVRALRWQDLDLQSGMVHYRFKVDVGFEVQHYVRHRVRSVPLGRAKEALVSWRDRSDRPESPYVFPHDDGSRRGCAFTDSLLARVQRCAGLAAPEDRPQRFGRLPLRAAFSGGRSFRPRYTVSQIGTVAIAHWYRQGHRGLALAALMGVSARGLSRFAMIFDRIDRDRSPVQKAAAILRAKP